MDNQEVGRTVPDGLSPCGSSQQAVSPVPASIPCAFELRPDYKGEFDELVARFADGSVFAEMMDDNSIYIDISWDDGKHCQWWLRSKKRLHNYVEYDPEGEPPRYTAQGLNRRPDLPDYSAQAIEARRAETAQTGSVHESAVGTADAPNSSRPNNTHNKGETP